MRTLILAVVLLVMPLAGCATRYQYPDSVTMVAVGACEQNGGPAAYCECVIRWLQNNVPYDQFAYQDAQVQRGAAMPAQWWTGINSCR